MKPKILKQQGLAFFQLSSHLFSFGSNAIGAESYVLFGSQLLIQKHAESLGHGLEAHLGIGLSLGPAEMRGENHSGPTAQSIFNSWQRLADTRVLHYAAVFERDIEVDTHEHALVRQ